MKAKARGFFGRFLDRVMILILFSLGTITAVSATKGFQLTVPTLRPQRVASSLDKSSNANPSAQEQRISDALETLKERASAQQAMIATLITITSLYAAILSFAAYGRLQQMKEETKDAVGENAKKIDDAIKRLTQQLTELGNEVRADIPAIHGIGRRLEELLAQLEQRLPIDGDATTQDKYGVMSSQNVEQIAIDEMVINSLDIFNIRKDVGKVRTVSRLYVALGQYYFVRSTVHRTKNESSLAEGTFVRANIYFEKAAEVDPSDPVAWRALGVLTNWRAQYLKENLKASEYDKKLLSLGRHYLLKSLEQDEREPGSLDGMAWSFSEDGQYSEAISFISRLIDLGPTMNVLHKRKYLLFAYLNRVRYRSSYFLDLPKEPSPAEVNHLELIRNDIADGFDLSIKLSAVEVYKERLLNEILSDGELKLFFSKHQILQESIDQVIAVQLDRAY